MSQPVWSAWALLGFSAMGTCAGNLLLKQVNLASPSLSSLSVLTSPWFLSAIACYLFDLFLFAQALQQLPVSAAVPVVSGIRMAATAIFAFFFFDEHLNLSQIFASSLIVTGIVIMLRT